MDDLEVRTLLALVRLYEAEGRATIRKLAPEVGRNVAVTHKILKRLRRQGLVTWEDNLSGTLRPLVKEITWTR